MPWRRANVPGPDNQMEWYAMNDDNRIEVSADNYFAMIPEWVMYADISKSAVMVYLVLNRYANSKTGKCFPSRETVIEKARISKNTLDKCLKELQEIGAISISKRRNGTGLYASNLYTVHMIRPRDTNPKNGIEQAVDGGLVFGISGSPIFGADGSPKSNPLIIEDNQSQRTREDISTVSSFEDFWSVYPKKEAVGAARKAWKTALKKTTAETLIRAASLYALRRKGEDPQFTAHGSTWLNQERWLDEPDQPAAPKATARGAQVDRVQTALERIGRTQQREITQ